jgi:hypothetical protein
MLIFYNFCDVIMGKCNMEKNFKRIFWVLKFGRIFLELKKYLTIGKYRNKGAECIEKNLVDFIFSNYLIF